METPKERKLYGGGVLVNFHAYSFCFFCVAIFYTYLGCVSVLEYFVHICVVYLCLFVLQYFVCICVAIFWVYLCCNILCVFVLKYFVCIWVVYLCCNILCIFVLCIYLCLFVLHYFVCICVALFCVYLRCVFVLQYFVYLCCVCGRCSSDVCNAAAPSALITWPPIFPYFPIVIIVTIIVITIIIIIVMQLITLISFNSFTHARAHPSSRKPADFVRVFPCAHRAYIRSSSFWAGSVTNRRTDICYKFLV